MRDPDRAREVAPKDGWLGRRLTYEDYCRMPAGERYELVEGELRVVPSPTVFHQELSKRLQFLLIRWVEERHLGKVYNAPIDVLLSEHNVVQPDLLCVLREKLEIIRKANIQGAPDLVVEILSPSTEEWDRVTKRQVYAKFGVRELWFVDPAGRSVEVACLTVGDLRTVQTFAAGATLTTPLLPGFVVDIDELFREDDFTLT